MNRAAVVFNEATSFVIYYVLALFGQFIVPFVIPFTCHWLIASYIGQELFAVSPAPSVIIISFAVLWTFVTIVEMLTVTPKKLAECEVSWLVERMHLAMLIAGREYAERGVSRFPRWMRRWLAGTAIHRSWIVGVALGRRMRYSPQFCYLSNRSK